MRGPRLTEENLRNQVDVVKEEIRVNVLNRPYGGFPWLKLPPVMFDTFPNAHDGYGSFDDLESATVADAAEFFDTLLRAGNAVLAVAGDFDVAEARALVERHFGDVPARPAPARPDFAEPRPDAERRESYTDGLAPLPAVAAGWRVPDPIADFAGYLPYVVLGRGAHRRRRLPAGRAAGARDRIGHQRRRLHRLHGRAVRGARPDRAAPAGAPAAGRRRGQGAARDRRGAGPARHRRPGAERAGPARRAMATHLLRETDRCWAGRSGSARSSCSTAARSSLNELPGRLGEVTEEQVRDAAAALRSPGARCCWSSRPPPARSRQ